MSKLVEYRPKSDQLNRLANQLTDKGHDLKITRNLKLAKNYLRQRYAKYPKSKFGLMASSRDRSLEKKFGVPNGHQSTRYIEVGPWYNDDENTESRLSCKHLEICITEYEAQGLELDAVLLAWGTDFLLQNGQWSIANARGYKEKSRVLNPLQLRANAYRVLLTRGRDAHVVFVPPTEELDETWEFLCSSGFRELIGNNQ